MEQQVEQKIVKSWAHFTETRARVVTLAWCVGIASACSSAREANDRLGFSPELDGAAGAAGARGDRGSPGSSTLSMGGQAAEDGGGQDQVGAAGAAGNPDVQQCQPGADAPDDDFEDTNCDGIDGDASQAIFVSTAGSDEAAGSRTEPVRTLQHAIELASEQRKDVYVCNGTYTENVVIEQPVSLYGGYDCNSDWRRIRDRAIVEPESGVPLSILGVQEAMTLERFAFRAPAGARADESSQAGRIVDSIAVRLLRVELRARDGAAGKPGVDGKNHVSPQATYGGNGANAAVLACHYARPTEACLTEAWGGDRGITSECTDPHGVYRQRGGAGGKGANAALTSPVCQARVEGQPGYAGSPVSPTKDGTDGAPATNGTSSSFGFGSISDGSYRATNAGTAGGPGERGLPGRGGQGDSSSIYRTHDFCEGGYSRGGGGGQGGFGGCAGYPGTPGGGGGASLGLVVVDSQVTLEWSRVLTGDGGKGGRGGRGADGQRGGEPGKGGLGVDSLGAQTTFRAESGGRGGDGSKGGDGGAGGGGPSVGIVVVGHAPELLESTIEIGQPGMGGAAASGPNAADGLAADIYTVVPRRKQ